ncbi:MAG: hypothetical protein QXL15_02135 [Candidatus Korarchaeota archaeon]
MIFYMFSNSAGYRKRRGKHQGVKGSFALKMVYKQAFLTKIVVKGKFFYTQLIGILNSKVIVRPPHEDSSSPRCYMNSSMKPDPKSLYMSNMFNAFIKGE